MSRRDPLIAVRHMLDHAEEAIDLATNRSIVDLRQDRMLFLALVKLVEIVGEAANRTPNTFREQHPEIPWRLAIATRNRLTHGYDEVDINILWEIVHDDFPSLVKLLREIVGR